MSYDHDDLPGLGAQVGPLRPDWGDGWADLACDRCGAGWVGPIGEVCSWCIDTLDRLRADERRLLLDPPWLRSSAGNPRYDELSEIDKAVWDRTRGQRRGTDSIKTWAGRLARAVRSGLITKAEARAAFDRAKRQRSA